MRKSNIILIGMPGAGKSTVGVLLAKTLGKGFVDTDLLIQLQEGCTLQETLDTHGYQFLRAAESKVLESINEENLVIATGGSAVHSDTGMQTLRSNGVIIHLDADIDTLKARISNFSTRGIAANPNFGFAEIFAERQALYQRYADITVGAAASPDAVVATIVAEIGAA